MGGPRKTGREMGKKHRSDAWLCPHTNFRQVPGTHGAVSPCLLQADAARGRPIEGKGHAAPDMAEGQPSLTALSLTHPGLLTS